MFLGAFLNKLAQILQPCAIENLRLGFGSKIELRLKNFIIELVDGIDAPFDFRRDSLLTPKRGLEKSNSVQ